ncbi:MAG: hypothetical protein EOM50_15430 [Erysipelotrichia bacterium]|nr:hypothetical protein [Erysipelotrichia bacterium]
MNHLTHIDKLIASNKHLQSMYGFMFYSSIATLKKGKFYFLGVNPGGKGSSIVQFDSTYTKNAYLDESWDNGKAIYPIGQAPLQLRVQKLFDALGIDLREVCASNLIFKQTKNIHFLTDPYALADACFPIHRYIIEEVVKPEFIISMGKTVFDYFVDRQGFTYSHEFSAGHAQWSIRVAKKEETTLINVPHLSYYDPFSSSAQTQSKKRQALKQLQDLVFAH